MSIEHVVPIFGAGVSAVVSAAAIVGVESSSIDSAPGGLIGVTGLAGVCAFLFRWGIQSTKEARAEAATAVEQLRRDHEAEIEQIRVDHRAAIEQLRADLTREIERLRADADNWRDHYLNAIKPKEITE